MPGWRGNVSRGKTNGMFNHMLFFDIILTLTMLTVKPRIDIRENTNNF